MSELLQDRVPPQNIEAEQAVLGSVFLESDALISIREYIEPYSFYQRRHRVFFQVMIQLSDRNEAIDVVTVKDRLEQENLLEDAGGLSYLSELALSVPTAANASYYAKIVEEKYQLRKLIEAGTNIVTQAFEQSEDTQVIMDDAERMITEVSENRNRSGFLAISDVLNTAFENIDNLSRNSEEITGLPTGYPALDKMTAGFQQEELIILAARPAVGKTAFALNIAQNVGTKTGKAVAIFSLEMAAESLVNRMICAEGSLSLIHI